MHDNEGLIGQLLQAGARGYLLKSDARRHLIAAVEALASHKPFLTGAVPETLLRAFTERQVGARPTLSPRERQIVQLIAEGYTNKTIAQLLHIGLKTVETHRLTIMRKLELGSSAALVRYAIRNKLIEP